MKALDAVLGEEISAAAQGPFLAARDILLLGGIEFEAISNVSELEVALLLLGKRRRGLVRLVEDVAHVSSHKARGLISLARASSLFSKLLGDTAWRSSSMECSTDCKRRRATLRARSWTVVSRDLLGTSA